jgi:hypothetical protein
MITPEIKASGAEVSFESWRESALKALAQVKIFDVVFGLFPLVLAVYIVSSTVVMVVDTALSVPYWDQWDELISPQHKILSSWLYSQHNEHRIAVPRLIFALDTLLVSGNNKLNLGFGLAIPLILSLALIAVLRKEVIGSAVAQLSITGAVFALLFSAMQWENFTSGFQVSFLAVELFMVLSFMAIGMGRASLTTLAAAILCETATVYTLASGIVVPFVAIILALWLRRPKSHVIVLSIALFCLIALYLHEYVTPTHHSDPLQSLYQPGKIALYVAGEIGNPIGQIFRVLTTRPNLHWAQALGAVGIALFGIAAFVLFRQRKPIGVAGPVFLAIAGYVVGTALVTALGRVGFGADQALASRYASPVLLFWVALLLIGFVHLIRNHPRFRLGAMAAGVFGLTVLALAQPLFIREGRAWVLPRAEATTALLAGVVDQEALGLVYPNLPMLLVHSAYLRAKQRSVFSEPWSHWLDTPLTENVAIADQARCRGEINAISPVPTAQRPEWRASGWAWDNERRAAAQRIVITDGADRVIGYGVGGFEPSPSEMSHHGSNRSGWHGHFSQAAPASIIAYAVLDHYRTACRLTRRR